MTKPEVIGQESPQNGEVKLTLSERKERRREMASRRPAKSTLVTRKEHKKEKSSLDRRTAEETTDSATITELTDLIEKFIPDVKVSTLRNVYDKNPITVSLKKVMLDHLHDETIEKQITQVKRARSQDRKDELKKKLPCYIVAKLKTKIDKHGKKVKGVSREHFESSGIMQFDIDKLEKQQLPEVLERIWKKIPGAFCAFISPSGNGLRFMIQLAEDITDASQYSRIYKMKVTEFSEVLSVELDSTSDATRKWYYSHAG